MRKSEFIAAVAAQADMSQRDTEKVLDAMCPVIVKTCVEDGEEISLPIGKFKQKVNSPKTGINPLTGKKMNVPESKSLAFKASKTIKQISTPTTPKKGKK